MRRVAQELKAGAMSLYYYANTTSVGVWQESLSESIGGDVKNHCVWRQPLTRTRVAQQAQARQLVEM